MRDEAISNEGEGQKESRKGYPDLRERLRDYALRIIKMYASLPKNDAVAQVIGRQVLKSGTSPGAHHREASRAHSNAEFTSKMEGGLQELDETDYWLDLLVGSGTVSEKQMKNLIDETDELICIFTTIVKNVKGRGR
ncbi:MAG: four helix bundle protein [Phycisphaerae bacterium]|nr:four helix bundle protein [Phycisphaerae bacterium]